MSRGKKWSREEVVRVFEVVLERGSDLFSSLAFRGPLGRDENLIANQLTREANGNLAYRSVDFKIDNQLSDEAFWSRIEGTPYNDLIEDNAAVAMVKMAEKLKLLE
ncbi:MAG: hypothetical protein HY466_04985 [Deltaproteobacteria bacterium]|nr:hypothetical protein [Deltaproteobacteria bacterium]